MREIKFSKKAKKHIDNLDASTRERILKVLARFRNDPGSVDLKKLGGLKNKWRIAVGRYRVIFSIRKQEKDVYILDVLPRKNAY
ncbi:MAG: type II toxin-antitoxin system RelE/ParE family toxin [Candidatus Eremiobacteraeota bacterium]|nr:type II toxin-antitoxin system RelE/ParE family toxin [Candidatus Eremiobacteraeota bacterium]